MRFNFDSKEPIPGEKPPYFMTTEGALVLVGAAAAAALVFVKWVAVHGVDLAHWLMPSIF